MEDIIIRVLDGTATEQEKFDLKNWIEESEENKKYYLDIYQLWISSRLSSQKIDVEKAFLTLTNRIENKYNETSIKNRSRLRNKWLIISGAIAASILLIFSFRFFLLPDSDKEVNYSQIVAANENKQKVELEDGTIVWLNSYTTLLYPADFNKKTRQVKIDGEAYFEVAHNNEKSFVVDLGEDKITVLGTAFNVNNRSDNPENEVVLLKGSISLHLQGVKDDIVLQPNEKAFYSKAKKTINLESVDANLYNVWTKNKLVFDKEKLSHVIEMLEKWYDIEINCPEGEFDQIKVSFTVVDETIEQTLKVMSLVAPINYSIKGDIINITPK